MYRYCVTNELDCFDFHDAYIRLIEIGTDTLTIHFHEAIVSGSSRPKRHPSCTLNDGEDRYALPELLVTFCGYVIHSIERGGCWTQNPETGKCDVLLYPPRLLDTSEHAPLINCINQEQWAQVYGLKRLTNQQAWKLEMWINRDFNNEAQYYELTLSADFATASWDEFGKAAWYVN